MSRMRACKSFLIMLALLSALLTSGAAVAKQDVTVELFYSAAWHDVSDRWRVTKGEIVINHGAGNEQTGVVPSDASLTFDNRDGEMNPENRKSSLFGLIGHNTPIRITVSDDIRFSGQVVAWKPRRAAGTLDSTRGDAWVLVQAQGTIRRLGQGNPPVRSALNRTMLAAASGTIIPAELWSLEDEPGAKLFSSAVGGLPGTGEITFSDTDKPPVPGGHSGIVGSARSVSLTLGSFVSMPVRPYTDTGQWAIQGAFISDDLDAGEPRMAATLANGNQISINVSDFGILVQRLAVDIFDPDGGSIFFDDVDISNGGIVGEPMSLMMAVVDTGGGNDEFVARVLDGNGTIRAEITTTNVGYDKVSKIVAATAGGNTDTPFVGASHIGLFTNPSFDIDVDTVGIARAASGWAGERAGDRADRLCGEEGIAFTIVGTAAETQPMGPQLPDTTLNLFDEIARTDAGIIHDTRTQLGLTFRTGRSLHNQG